MSDVGREKCDGADSSDSSDSWDLFDSSSEDTEVTGVEYCESGSISNDQCTKSDCCQLAAGKCTSAIGTATCKDIVWELTWTTTHKKAKPMAVALVVAIIFLVLLTPVLICCLLVFCCGMTCFCIGKKKQENELQAYTKAKDATPTVVATQAGDQQV